MTAPDSIRRRRPSSVNAERTWRMRSNWL